MGKEIFTQLLFFISFQNFYWPPYHFDKQHTVKCRRKIYKKKTVQKDINLSIFFRNHLSSHVSLFF